ncbi:MAG: DUF2059 domain-containing protein [Deltaproteobacteria bacterium]|jgi:hypothetical protein|nr:DUF2059 domain-containing protein [Deltaproteobacteria bacterium]
MGAAILAVGVLMQAANGEAKTVASKQEMIRELLAIVGIVGMAEQMREHQSNMELMLMQPTYHQMMEMAASEQAELSEENRQLLLARLEDFDAFAERFHALFVERLNFSEIIEAVYLPLYDKYFDEVELEQMLAFYRTPVGRKSIEVMPTLMQEAAHGVEEAVRPISIGLIQQIVAEEAAKLAD